MTIKVPPAIPETFIALELAYGPDPHISQLCAFCGVPDMELTHMDVEEAMAGTALSRPTGPQQRTKWTTQERLEVSLWVAKYVRWKNPHEYAALEDAHLDRKPKYDPLA